MYGKLIWTGAAAGLGLLAVTGNASASGFAIRENSAEGVGTAFAGNGSRADDVSTVFNNPAGMTRLDGNQFEFAAAAPFLTVDFHGSATNTAFGPVQGNTGSNGGRTGLIPSLYGVFDITDRLKGGIAVTVPFGNTIKYNSDFFGRYSGIDNAAITTDIDPNLAYKINDRLSVGGGISAQYFMGQLSAALNQSALGASDALFRAKGSDWGVGYNFGILGEPWDGTRIGATYRSKISHQIKGDGDFLSVSPALAGTPALVSGPGIVDISLPATTGLSVTHDINDQWSISSDIQWTQWSTFKSTNFTGGPGVFDGQNQGYRDSWLVSVGAVYKLTDDWSLRGGLGWDQSPVDNRYRIVGLPDQDRYMAALGFGYKFNERWSADGAYAHYFASHASMNSSVNASSPSIGVGTTVLTGNYQLSIDYLAASVRYKF